MSYNWKCCSFYPNNFGASALYYNNGIEIRVNDTIFSIFTWVLSYFILVLLIVISTIMYRFFKKHSKIKLF